MYQFSDFVQLLNDYIALFDSLTQIEQEKLMAAKKNRVSFVEEAMKQEQAYILKLKGFDQKREQMQQSLGFASMSFQEILNAVSSEEKEVLLPLFHLFKERISLLQEVSNNAKAIIEINLHTIQKTLANQQSPATPQKQQMGKFHSRKI